jgi:hypothetical protein
MSSRRGTSAKPDTVSQLNESPPRYRRTSRPVRLVARNTRRPACTKSSAIWPPRLATPDHQHGAVSEFGRVAIGRGIDLANRAPVEASDEFARLGIDVDDIADVAVVDLLVVVILDLHDLVAGRKRPCKTLDLAFAGGVQGQL